MRQYDPPVMAFQEDRKAKHRWLQWIGLKALPPDPHEWVAAASFSVDDALLGTSFEASELAASLGQDGIEAQQRHYVAPDTNGWNSPGPPAQDRIRMAVLVRRRDLGRARAAASTYGQRLVPLSDDDLARLAMQTPDPSSDETATNGPNP